MPSLFPTAQHRVAALYATEFFRGREGVDAVLLTCSCARGKAVRESCVDMTVLLQPDVDRGQLERAWTEHSEGSPVVTALAQHGTYAHIDMDLRDGDFREHYHGWCSGPDEFELEVGNVLHYGVPLFENGPRLQELKREWLPYYSTDMQQRRLAMVREYCLNNIDHVAPYVARELYFQAFRRLYNAVGEFLQAVFIARRVYPVAYDKWVKEQLVEILELPELYPQFVELVSIKQFEGPEIGAKAERLLELVGQHCVMG